jgi:hypothetical protein
MEALNHLYKQTNIHYLKLNISMCIIHIPRLARALLERPHTK